MGMRTDTQDEHMLSLADQCEKKLLAAVSPNYLYRVLPVKQAENGVYCGELFLQGKAISAHLKDCGQAILFCATLSAGADLAIRQASAQDVLAGLMTDAIANALIEQLCDMAEKEILSRFSGLFPTWRFSPGYGDLPISVQEQFLHTLNAKASWSHSQRKLSAYTDKIRDSNNRAVRKSTSQRKERLRCLQSFRKLPVSGERRTLLMNFDFSSFLILDGGMGTMMQAQGLPPGGIPELWNLEHPEKITAIHSAYVESGTDMVYTNTFGCNRLKMARTGHSVSELISAAIKNAKASGAKYVALDIGPIGQMLEPTGTLKFEEAYDIFREQIEAAGDDVDCYIFETMSDLQEVRAGVLAAKEHGNKPIFVTMSFEANGRTFTGCEVPAATLTLEGLGIDAIGVNCSLGPEELVPIVKTFSEWTNLPIIVKPNAGLPDPVTNEYNFPPDRFAECMKPFIEMGAVIFGGCCGTTPDHIKAVSQLLRTTKPVNVQFPYRQQYVPPIRPLLYASRE